MQYILLIDLFIYHLTIELDKEKIFKFDKIKVKTLK